MLRHTIEALLGAWIGCCDRTKTFLGEWVHAGEKSGSGDETFLFYEGEQIEKNRRETS